MYAERQALKPTFIPLCAPHLEGREWDYVRDCLDSNWVSSVGPYVTRFEKAMAQRLGVRGGVAPADEVLVPTLTFIAPANAVRYCGAWPVFIDVDPHTWQMDVALVERFL